MAPNESLWHYLCKNEKANSTQYSQAVTHPSTNRAQHCLTSVIRRNFCGGSESFSCYSLLTERATAMGLGPKERKFPELYLKCGRHVVYLYQKCLKFINI